MISPSAHAIDKFVSTIKPPGVQRIEDELKGALSNAEYYKNEAQTYLDRSQKYLAHAEELKPRVEALKTYVPDKKAQKVLFKQLEEFYEMIHIGEPGDSLQVKALTKDVVFRKEGKKPRFLGRFIIWFDKGSNYVYCRNTVIPPKTEYKLEHPHAQAGKICFGSNAEFVFGLIKRRSYLEFLAFMKEFMENPVYEVNLWPEYECFYAQTQAQ